MELFPAAFLSGSGDLFPYLVLTAVNLALKYGKSPESAFAYAAYGMLLCGPLKDPARYVYYRWGASRKAEDLQQKYPHLLGAMAPTRSADTVSRTHTSTTGSLEP